VTESTTQREIRAKLGAMKLPFFRYQVGTFLTSEGAMVKIGVKGVSDLIGITPYTITPEDVGRTVGIFTALEVKKPRGGRVSEEQKSFLRTVNRLGGIGAVVKSAAEAESVVTELWKCKLVAL
jgi:hypothetical protein